MKRYIYSICAMAAMVLAAGCSKESINESQKSEGLVFTATIECAKTVLDANDKQSWENGDEISINGVIYVASVDDGSATATFTKKNEYDDDPVPVDGKYSASYPVSLFDRIYGTAALSATQTYEGAGILSKVNPLYAEGESTVLSFKNICGLLELKLSGKGTVTSITVTDDEAALSGEFTLDNDYTAVLSEYAEYVKEGVTLVCPDGVELGETAVPFYIAVPAGEYGKLRITVNDNAGKSFSAALKEGVTATVSRSTIHPITLAVEFTADPCLNGTFSVAAGKKVKFTRGNLCYNNGEWTLEDSQAGSADSGRKLFFWTNDSQNSYGSADSYAATSATEMDWGKAFGSSDETFTTLSSEEWEYLLHTRLMDYAYVRYTNTVTIPVTIENKEYKGLFIYPDEYDGYPVDEDFTWAEIYAKGIVFLPADGRRSGSETSYSGSNGYYWAKDSCNKGTAFYMGFSYNGVKTNVVFGRYMGYSVRLVKPVE